MVTFASDLLDGLELLSKRTDGVLKSCTELANLLSSIAKIEKEYSKKLSKLAQTAKKDFQKTNPIQSEVGTTLSAWDTILTELEKVSDHHNQFADNLEEDLVKNVNTYVKEKFKVKKKLDSDGQKLMKDMKDSKDLLLKARSKYVRLSKEAEQADQIHQKGKGDMSMKPNKLAQLAAKASGASDKAAQADTEYRQQLESTNHKQVEYYNQTQPALLQEYQQFEEDRLHFIKEIAEKYAVYNAEKPSFYTTTCENVTHATQSINVDADIQTYINENKTGVKPPPDVQYAPYTSEAPPIPSNKPPAKPKNVKPGKIGKYKAHDPTEGKDWGLNSSDQTKSFEEKQQKLNGQLAEIEKLILTETKAKDGLENLVRFYASDPVAQKKAEDQVREIEEKLHQLQNAKSTVQHQLSTLSSGGGSFDFSGGQKVKALYDYQATCDTELTFKEGEVLTVSEQDDSGWWYCENSSGQTGFVPNNYVELL